MGFVAALAVAVLLWLALQAVARALDAWLKGAVHQWLSNRGVSLSWTVLWWESSAPVAPLTRLARRGGWFWRQWYTAGAVVGVMGMLGGMLFMLVNLWWLIRPPTAADGPPIMTPVLPFVNVPSTEILHYFIALVVSGGLHELGHALAALSHGCGVESMGAALMGVFPAAFVNIKPHDLDAAALLTRIKIHAAGVWHNVVLAAGVLLLLAIFPFLCVPFFVPGVYVVRSTVPGLSAGVTVQSLNGCPIKTYDDWTACWLKVVGDAHQSFCASNRIIQEAGVAHNCCEHDYEGGLQCFHEKSKLFCLSARQVIASGQRCSFSSPCEPNSRCLDASLALDDRLMWLQIQGTTSGGGWWRRRRTYQHQLAVVAGSPAWLWRSLVISPQVPRAWGGLFGGADLEFQALLRYIASLSAALALLNTLPVFYLDGSNMIDSLWLYFGGSLTDYVLEGTKVLTTFLVAANLLLSSRSLFF